MINRLFLIPTPRRWITQNTQIWLRLLIVVGVLLASAYLGPMASRRILMLLLLLVPGLAVVLVFLRRPPSGLVALIVASLVVPFAIGTGTETSLNVTVLLLSLLTGLWLFDMMVGRKITIHSARPFLPLLGLALTAMLAFMAGQLPWFPTAGASLQSQVGGLAIFLLSAAAFLLVAHQVQDLRWLERLTWIFLALGALYIVGQVMPGVGRLTWRLFQSGATGSLFWIWLVALAFAQAIFNRKLHKGWRLALGGLVLATFYISLFQSRSWASGWLPPLVAVVVIIWVGVPRLGLLVILVGGGVLALNQQKVLNLIIVGGEQYSLITRWEAWRILAKIIAVNPILGLGPANYYWYTSLYPILGWYVQFNSHNQYVDIVAQTGLLGLFFFLWFAWEVGGLGWRLRTRVPEGFARAYVYGALGGLAGTLAAGMLGDWVLPFVYNIGLAGFRASVLGWLFLGGLVALEQSTAKVSKVRAENESFLPQPKP